MDQSIDLNEIDHNATRTQERGFTLVELMVVVAIIALLAAIIIPNYIHARAEAAVSESEANLKQIATALELYNGDNQTYPASGTVAPALFGGAGNKYMTGTPLDAVGHLGYKYTLTPAAGGVPASYTIVDLGAYDPSTLATLPNGAAGAPCAAACTTLNYDPTDGIYGSK